MEERHRVTLEENVRELMELRSQLTSLKELESENTNQNSTLNQNLKNKTGEISALKKQY
jgi:hypothetical protein